MEIYLDCSDGTKNEDSQKNSKAKIWVYKDPYYTKDDRGYQNNHHIDKEHVCFFYFSEKIHVLIITQG